MAVVSRRSSAGVGCGLWETDGGRGSGWEGHPFAAVVVAAGNAQVVLVQIAFSNEHSRASLSRNGSPWHVTPIGPEISHVAARPIERRPCYFIFASAVPERRARLLDISSSTIPPTPAAAHSGPPPRSTRRAPNDVRRVGPRGGRELRLAPGKTSASSR